MDSARRLFPETFLQHSYCHLDLINPLGSKYRNPANPNAAVSDTPVSIYLHNAISGS
jgi:hypothetical protein